MLDQRLLDDVRRFLEGAGKSDLYAYYGLPVDADAEAIDLAVKKRRTWAQGQQANPKFKAEALFLIRHNALLRRVLVEEGAAYREAVGIDEVAPPPTEIEEIDAYTILGASPTATADELTLAYRERVRYLRFSQPPERLKAALVRVEGAWAALGDPAARARYDQERGGGTIPPENIAALGPLSPGEPRSAGFTVPTPEYREPARRSVAPVHRPPPVLPPPTAPPEGGPKLETDLQEREEIEVGDRPHRLRVGVRNIGNGPMPGRLTADRAWVEIAHPQLDPVATSQFRVVTIDPEAVPASGGSATLSVVTDHGERRSLTLVVRHRGRQQSPRWLGFGLGGLALLGVGFWLVARTRAPEPSRVVLHVDPAASHVYVDGKELGQGAEVELALDRSRSHTIRIEAEGREPHEETLPAGDDAPSELTVHLTPAGDDEVELGRDAQRVVEAAVDQLAPCFVSPEAPPIVQATFVAHVTGAGELLDVAVEDASYTSPAAEECVRVVFSQLSFPRSSARKGVVRQRLALPMPEPLP